MNGVFNVLKPPGMTSHDVVSFLRRQLQEKRIGHAGTLDPQAAGVLPVCTGQATRLLEYMGTAEKEYLCYLTFGITTNTQDAWGVVESRLNAQDLELNQILDVIPRFLGEITQITPAYSAVKIRGVPLYKLARQGEKVEPIPRQVRIHYLRVLEYRPPVLVLLAGCSQGTYIRTLCHDLGQAVGRGGHMSFLLRTRVGPFRLEDSRTLEEISLVKDQAALPWEVCVRELPRINLDKEQISLLRHGQKIEYTDQIIGNTAAIFDEEGLLQAITEIIAIGNKTYIKPKKVLNLG